MKLSTTILQKQLMEAYTTKSTPESNENAKTAILQFYKDFQNVRVKHDIISYDKYKLMSYTINLIKSFHYMKIRNYVAACDEICLAISRMEDNGRLSSRDRDLVLLSIEEGLKDEIILQRKRTYKLLYNFRLFKRYAASWLSIRKRGG